METHLPCLEADEGGESWLETRCCSWEKQRVINGTTHCLEEQIFKAKQIGHCPSDCFLGRQWPVEMMRIRCSGCQEPDSCGALFRSLQPLLTVSPSSLGYISSQLGGRAAPCHLVSSSFMGVRPFQKVQEESQERGSPHPTVSTDPSLCPHHTQPPVCPLSHAPMLAPASVAAVPSRAPGLLCGPHSTGWAHWSGGCTQGRTRAAPTHWLQAACSLPPAGTGIDLACFRGSAAASASPRG